MLKITRIPNEEPKSVLYTVTLNGERAELNWSRVSSMPYNTEWPGCQRPLDQTEEAPFLHFTADEPVILRAEASFDFSEAIVRPLSRGITPAVDGRAVTMVLSKPGQYTLELDGIHRALTVFFDPPAEPIPEGAVVFGPGVHKVGRVMLQDNATVYVDQDAVVYGCFMALDVRGVRILGTGIIDGSLETRESKHYLIPICPEGGLVPKESQAFLDFMDAQFDLDGIIRLYRVEGAEVRGPILRDCSTFNIIPAQCTNVTIENVKTVGQWRYNSDGIDLFNCTNVTIRNCFLRDFDDCMVIKGIAGWDDRNNENILVSGLVVWCDWGSALEVGAETNAPEYRNIVFEDCDIIHAAHVFMRLHHYNRARLHNICYRDIRCEYSKYTLPCVYQRNMDAPYTDWDKVGLPDLICDVVTTDVRYGANAQKGKMHDIFYENIQILADEGLELPPIVLRGLDAEHDTRRIVIDGISRNGKRLTAEDFGRTANAFADEAKFL